MAPRTVTQTVDEGGRGGAAIAALTPGERGRLVRLCARLSGDPAAAEDLAQETLLEAWRHAARLTDPGGRDAWLAAIARNVCRRHGRALGRVRTREPDRPPIGDEDGAGNRAALDLDEVADPNGDELALALGRDELAALLDRALALLPPATRGALIAHYVDETPQAEIAARLGVSEGAVAVRIHRGKLAFRKALATPALAAAAAAHGLAPLPGGEADDGWRETRIWCPLCGARRLLARFPFGSGAFALRCPGCPRRMPGADIGNIVNCHGDRDLAGLRSAKPALSRVMAESDGYYRAALASGGAPCSRCGSWAPVALRLPPELPAPYREARGIHLRCGRCGYLSDLRLPELTLWTPAGRAFWKAHPRLRLLPEREIEAEGRPALVVTFADVAGGARLAVVTDQETYAVLAVHGDPTE